MIIQTINNHQYTSPNFERWRRDVRIGHSSKLKHRNDTCFFRDSEFWAKLNYYLVKKYINVPKVNVYSYGCSDGSEPFTFVMQMLSIHKESANKFLPVIAKDYDLIAINKARSKNYYFLDKYEKQDINYYTNNNFDRFFKLFENNYYYISDEIHNNVEFSVANIFDDYKKIEPENSVVLARNFWPYIERKKERQDLLNNLAKHLGENSILVIGDYDIFGTGGEIQYQLIKAGFMRTENKYICELRK